MPSEAIQQAENDIAQDSFDVKAYHSLFQEAQKLSVAEAREYYEKFLQQFPTAAGYWKLYIEHELDNRNYAQAEALFGKCLVSCNDVALYQTYLMYMKERKTVNELNGIYKFVLDQCGNDFHSTPVWRDYITYLNLSGLAVFGDEGMKAMEIRRSYQRAIKKPKLRLKELWDDYCSYERNNHPAIADKVINDCYRTYTKAAQVSRKIDQKMKTVDRSLLAVPPRDEAAQALQLELWENLINYEKENPMQYQGKDETEVVKRTRYAYKQCLKHFVHHEKVWIEGAIYLYDAGQQAQKAGQSNTAKELMDASEEMFRSARQALPRSLMVAFGFADQLESRGKVLEAKALYETMLKDDEVDITLVYINFMKCCRRTSGIKDMRDVFKRVTKDERCGHQACVASAMIELAFASSKPGDKTTKKKEVCVNVFEWGLKKFSTEPHFVKAYLEHLSQRPEQNNTRALFERVIDSLDAEGASDIWQAFHAFEVMYGDLKSIERVEMRREQKYPEEFSQQPVKHLVDRYRFMDLMPASSEALKTFGIASKKEVSDEGLNESAPQTTSIVESSSSKFTMPDIDQLGPFRPTRTVLTDVVFMPKSVREFLKRLPPPGNYVERTRLVDVDRFMKQLSEKELPDVQVSMDQKTESISRKRKYAENDAPTVQSKDMFRARQIMKAGTGPN